MKSCVLMMLQKWLLKIINLKCFQKVLTSPKCLYLKFLGWRNSVSAWMCTQGWNPSHLVWPSSGLSMPLGHSLGLILQLVRYWIFEKDHLLIWPGNGIWAVIWCVCNIAAYGLVILAMKRSNKMFIIPALIISIFDVIVGIIQCIVSFFSLWIFS